MGYEPVKDETKESYLKIWTHYAVGNFTQEQLAALFNCSQDTVHNAIMWSAENRVRFSDLVFVEAAKEAVETKLREFNNDLARLKGRDPVNWNAVIGIEKLVFTYRDLFWRLNGVISDRSIVQINMPPSHGSQKLREFTEAIHEAELTPEEDARVKKALEDIMGIQQEAEDAIRMVFKNAEERKRQKKESSG